MAANYSKEKRKELWDKVISYMFEGQLLTNAIVSAGLTGPTFYNIMKDPDHPERLKEYACARDYLADLLHDKLFGIVHDRSRDDTPFTGMNHVQRDKLIADTYKWAMGKMSSKYADSVKLQGDAENPVETKLTIEHVTTVNAPAIKSEESEH